MRTCFVLVICLVSFCAIAEPDQDVNVLAEEFSMAMGIDQLLDATLQQTRDSLNSLMFDLSEGLKSQYPNLSASQSDAFDRIFVDYVDSVINSIDTRRAASLYAGIIAEGLPAEEIRAATEYYETPEGQKLLQVVSVAASQLNQYILDQMAFSTKLAQAKLSADLGAFLADMSAK